ncbi:Tautomerase-3 domain-containing protein [Favolaschia claudopus]|uniref:Tautomerase-3 domain-containing protein n=1 Tax=Favolaschia claudopus TaxID=2862362 RepID=A0AAW0DJ93_9AGAR
MPLHRFFVPKDLYTPADKSALAEAITEVYAILPKFYVVVLFIELDSTNFYLAGKSSDRMVRINVEHLARNFDHSDSARKRQFMARYEAALAPFTEARGIDWEVQIVDCDRELWNINGMAPPEGNSEEEQIWRKENRAVPPEEIKAMKAAGKY